MASESKHFPFFFFFLLSTVFPTDVNGACWSCYPRVYLPVRCSVCVGPGACGAELSVTGA